MVKKRRILIKLGFCGNGYWVQGNQVVCNDAVDIKRNYANYKLFGTRKRAFRFLMKSPDAANAYIECVDLVKRRIKFYVKPGNEWILSELCK